MSVITKKISVANPVIVESINSPLDARTRCNNEADFPNIEAPFIGMIIFTTDDEKYWVVTRLKAKLVGSMMIENYQIAEYVPLVDFIGGGGSGSDVVFVAGEGIKISESGEISVDTEVIATKAEIGDIAAVLDAINGEEV